MKLIFFICVLVFVAPNTFSFGRRDAVDNSQQENTKVILGQVVIYGSEPHTFAGIAEQNGTEYVIYPRETADELRALQGHLIEFTVILMEEAPGPGITVRPVSWRIIQ